MFWIAKRKKKKETELVKRREERVLEKNQAEEDIAEARKKMLSKQCMWKNWDYCSDTCSNFQEGFVYFMPTFNGKMAGYWERNYPKCRLWGGK